MNMNALCMEFFLEKATTTRTTVIKRWIRVRKRSMSTRARDKNNMYVKPSPGACFGTRISFYFKTLACNDFSNCVLIVRRCVIKIVQSRRRHRLRQTTHRVHVVLCILYTVRVNKWKPTGRSVNNKKRRPTRPVNVE